MDHWAIGKLIDWAAGKEGNETTKTALTNDIDKLAAELAGPTPSPVESGRDETPTFRKR